MSMEMIASLLSHPEKISPEEEAEYGVMTDAEIAALMQPPTPQKEVIRSEPKQADRSGVFAIALSTLLNRFQH